MDDCYLTRSPSISSFGTSHSSWSFVGEEDFDLLDQERHGSASESEMNELDGDDEQIEEENDDEESESSTDDDDISVLTEEDVLNDSSTLAYTDVSRVSEQLDQLSNFFGSPFTHMLEDFALKRNIRFMAVISAAIIVVIIFYSLLGIGKSEPSLFTSTESVCFVGEEHILGLQYRDAAPSFLHPFFETLLKPSISTWSVLSSSIPKLHANEPFSWMFNSESISALQDERRYFAKNQCEYVSIEHQFSAMNEAVQRYLRHTKKSEKPCRYESPILPDKNETMVDRKSTEPHCGKLRIDLQAKPLSLPKPTLPIPPSLANHLSVEPKIELLTPIPSPDSVLNMWLRKEIISVSKSIADLEHIENHCFEVVLDTKEIKSLKKKKKLLYKTDLSSIFTDSKLFESGELLENDFEKEIRQSKKDRTEVSAISSIKKAISKKKKRVHRDKFFEQFKRSVDNIAGKNRPKAFRLDEKINIGKERCVLNCTCNVLASLARTLASISLFPAVVGQTNAAKYINSLLDLSTCTGLRLVCEKCWQIRKCCPKERCNFFPWQRHFNTKRFLASQGHKMLQSFGKFGWSMPEKKRKSSGDKPKFKFDHPSRSTGSKKEMRSWQHKKKLVERYSKKNGIQDRIH